MSDHNKSYYQREVDRLYGDSLSGPKHFAQIKQSKLYMDNYHGEKIELDDLAKAAFMSPSHYARSFQKVYGLTPRVFLRDFRISKAKALIAQGMSITEVCHSVGYESLPTFSAVFKKCCGQTPRDYQKANKIQQANKSNPE